MNQRSNFPSGVAEKLKWYVYRLVDPRNGETFYVGKGTGDRVFQHVNWAQEKFNSTPFGEDEDAASLKFQRIKAIHSVGLEVGHIIHRHNIENEVVAYQIEAALIEAYPGLTNLVAGHGSGDYGCRHVEEIVREYSAEPFIALEPLILISIGRSYEEDGRSIYDAVRGVWRISVERARSTKLVLAHRRGIVLGAFRPKLWMEATRANFEWLEDDIEGRWGFQGSEAESSVAALYVGRRVPEEFRVKGAANPVRFVGPDSPV